MGELNIQIEPTIITATFPFDKAVIASVKSIGMRWNPVKKHWYMANNVQNRGLLERLGTPQPTQVVTNYNDYIPNPVLMQHQKDGVEIAKEKNRWLYAHDTGCGKTLTAIEIIKLHRKKALIICPLGIIQPAWFEDLGKFWQDAKAINLWKLWGGINKNGGKRDYQEALKRSEVCIVNYEGFKAQKDILTEAGFGIVILDESSRLKNHKSITSQDITRFCENIQFVYLLSGTPAPNSFLEWFSQIKIIDPTILGKSFWRFRNQYFFEKGFKWILFPHKEQELMDKIALASSSVRKEDVLDLPERVFINRDVMLSAEEEKAYNTMAKQLVAEINSKQISASNAAVKLMKLRQVTSGFLIDEDKKVHIFGKSKLVALSELLEEIGDKPVLIWTQFIEEGRQIKKLLGDKVDLINGTISQHDKEESIAKFKAGNIQYLCSHARSLGHGNTLTIASYAIYYSLSYSFEELYQSRDRIYRYGQRNACTYFTLIAPGTIDTVIDKALSKKGDVQGAILEYIKQFNKKS